MRDDLDKLLKRLETEGASAMPELYALTSPHLFGIITQILPEEALARSALKDVYSRIWEQRGVLESRHKGNPINYLRRLAHRSAMDSKFNFNIKTKLNSNLTNASEGFPKAAGVSDQDIRILKFAYLKGASLSVISDYESLTSEQVKTSLDRTLLWLKGVGS